MDTPLQPAFEPEIAQYANASERDFTVMTLRTYAITKGVKEELAYSKFMVSYPGFDPEKVNPDLLWGVYGTNSMSLAGNMASLSAQRSHAMIYQIDLRYKVFVSGPKNTVIDEKMAKESGFYNLDRLEMNFRREILERMMAYLEPKERANYSSGSDPRAIHEMLLAHPMLVHAFMAEEPACMAMSHSVETMSGPRLRMATVRNDPSRIAGVATRYHMEIETTI